MVVKIGNSEYLTRVNNMTAVEKEEYLNRVGEWLKEQAPLLMPKMNEETARFQNVIQCSVGWNDAECNAWTDGVKLLTAYAATGETWLPEMLYVKAARRSIKRMVEVLEAAEPVSSVRFQVSGFKFQVSGKPDGNGGEAQANDNKSTSGNSGSADGNGDGPQGASNGDITGGDKDGEGNDNQNENEKAGTVAPVPVRPKHIDQYVHLLPKKTQERAAKYGPLMRELEEAREKLRLLTEDRTAKSDDRAAWAKRVSSIDKEIGGIKRELDSEWEKLVKSGRVTVDDLGNAHVVPTGEPEGTVSGDKVQVSSEKAELTPEQRERRKNLRKWLTDTRRGNGAAREERVKKWHENFKEYLTMEGDAAFKDEKIIEAAKHYGIELEAIDN